VRPVDSGNDLSHSGGGSPGLFLRRWRPASSRSPNTRHFLDWLTSAFSEQANDFTVRFAWWKVFFVFGFLWALAFWPALHNAWWYADDFWLGEWTGAQRWGSFVIGNGRPLLGFWSYSFLLDRSPNDQWANILLRWFQGGVHVLNVTLLARLLWGVVRRWTAVLAALPFLLWPFNGDAVLIRSASFYAIAALLSFLGLLAIRVNDSHWNGLYWVSGAFLCGLSMLAMQTSAFASIAVWIVLVGLTAIQLEPLPWRRLLREGMFVAAGIMIGAAISYWLIKTRPIPLSLFAGRGDVAFDFHRALRILGRIDALAIVFPSFYPWWLQVLHVLLIASTLFAIILFGWTEYKRAKTIWRPILVLVCLVLCLAVPFSAQVVAGGQDAVVLRTLYLAPILFSACTIFTFQLFRHRVWLERATMALLLLILISYWPISREHAAEYVKCYQADMADLGEVEQHAAELGLTRVIVVPGTFFSLYNPHHFRYSMLCTHNSSLAYPWVREAFIRNRSELRPICQLEDMPVLARGDIDPQSAILHRALEQKKNLGPSSGPQFQRIEGTDVMGIFLPGKAAHLILTAPEGSASAAHATVSVNSLEPGSLGPNAVDVGLLQMAVSGLEPRRTYRLWLVASQGMPYAEKRELAAFKTNLAGEGVVQTTLPLDELMTFGEENTAERSHRRSLLVTPAESYTAELIQKDP
jgi:hypothetical protein